MKSSFPKLPDYEFTWRSIQIEPIPLSGERITLGALVKGGDQAFIAAKLVPVSKLKKMYGNEFGGRIADALGMCVRSAEEFYSNKPLSSNWVPPLEGFYASNANSSLAENIEEALLRAAMHCSSFSVSIEASRLADEGKSSVSAPEIWRKNILKEVTVKRADFEHYFEKRVPIRGSGVPMTFGFLSDNYVAQFDAIADLKGLQQGLVRAQSKLWQLDRLRDEETLFKPHLCELLLKTPPITEQDSDISLLKEFIEELQYEASRRELGIYTTESPTEAAEHLIEKAA